MKSVKRDLVLTQHGLVLVGRENKANSNKKKGGTNNAVEIITKKISLGELDQVDHFVLKLLPLLPLEETIDVSPVELFVTFFFV